jgi:hypothetical protein
MLGVSAWAFQTGNVMLGQIIGWSLVAAAIVNVSTGFCIPSFIYGLIFGKPSACETIKQSVSLCRAISPFLRFCLHCVYPHRASYANRSYEKRELG